MYKFITVLTYVFDLFILTSYMNKLFKKRKEQVSSPLWTGCFLLTESILYLNEIFTRGFLAHLSLIISVLISLLTIFALTFLYEAEFKHRLFVTVSFQIFALLGEAFFTLAVWTLNPSLLQAPTALLTPLMNFGSKIILFLLVLLCTAFWNRHMQKYSTPGYNLLLFSTPLISLVIMTAIPLQKTTDPTGFLLLLFSSLAVLNIVNYLLMEKIFDTVELKNRYQTMEQQIQYQKNKYIQLGATYKNSRSLLHDTKKHYFAISEYIRQEKYDRLQDYLHTAMDTMETAYAGVNTGNLVIDAFVSNFITITENSGIRLEKDISVDANRIPLNDYDLCVILGNLLDNCLNACSPLMLPDKMVQLEIYTRDNDTFIIHTKNSCTPAAPKKYSFPESSFQHGYGLKNIERIVENNHGIFQWSHEEYFEVIIVIPIIDARKRQTLREL